MKHYTFHLFIFILITALFISCKGKGNLQGNVFFKYNNYIGNKADASSDVYLFFKDDSLKKPLTTTCDLNGNFVFADIDAGTYILAVKSKNTRGEVSNIYMEFANSSLAFYDGMQSYIDSASYSKIMDNNLLEQHSVMKEQLNSLTHPDSISSDSSLFYAKIANSLSRKIIDKITDNTESLKGATSYIHLLLYGGMNKIKIKDVVIEKNKTDNEVIDFGLTDY